MEKNRKQKKRTGWKTALPFLNGSIHFFALCILSSMLASLCELIIPKIIGFTVDSLLGGEQLPPYAAKIADLFGGTSVLRTHLWITAALILVIALFLGLFKYGESVFNRLGSETLVETMRNRLFSHLERLPSAWFTAHQTGDIIQRCTSDVETLKSFLSEQMTSIISTVLLIGLSVAFLFTVSVPLAVTALLSIPVIIAYSAVFHGKIGDGFEYCDQNEGKLSAIAQENLTGVRVVRAFGREIYEVEKFTKQNNLYADAWIRLGRLMSLFWCMGDLISGLQQMIIMVYGTVLAVRGTLTVGDLIAAVSYNSMLIWPVRELGRTVSEMSKAGISVGRIGEIMDAPEEKDAPDAVDCDPDGGIEFQNVTFSYDGSADVLKNVSFRVKKGETLGIIGMTGSGKSTLAQLLCKLWELPEENGTIRVSGTDIRNIKTASLRRSVGIVLQEPFLFSRTLRDNIGVVYSQPAEHEPEIREAARSACLEETIGNFSDGWDTMVGERGVTLSGGQKQRVAIARMLAETPPVMIFDDSLSAVDSETDAKIRHALREKTADATVILISHRIQTLMTADHILVMAGGEVVEEGNHNSLIAENGIYKKIYDIQTGVSSGEEEEGGGI
ncbi:MAG: ABC transporter ATP-binding protein [Ruminococcaceae bacterium]|jgi:ATP-binding cassette subfamily B protein|nr:ABC transporter ATP-binding protein [Oscillospiraceae bacterium]